MAVTDKANMLCILKILQEYSDENHILKMKDLTSKLKLEYDIKPDRRTVYGAINTLIDMGYDISTYEENGIGYYLREREFEPAEIRLLIDAVYSFDYISKRQTEELLEKLRKQLSVNERKKYSYSSIIHTDKKSPNQEVFLNISLLDEAINNKKKISFTYLDYDFDKKLKPRREESYIVNPYQMVCENKKYYLICITEGHDSPGYYRVDMMKDIQILDDNIDFSKKDVNLDTASKVLFAYAGAPQQVTIRGDKTALRYVIESFGNDVSIFKKGDDQFEATFKTSLDGMFYWALQYMQHVEVLSPASLRERILKTLENDNAYKKLDS